MRYVLCGLAVVVLAPVLAFAVCFAIFMAVVLYLGDALGAFLEKETA